LPRKKPRRRGFAGTCEAVASKGLIAYMLSTKQFFAGLCLEPAFWV
jgi:hypothetical protein